MAQHDGTIANADGATVRADIQAAIQALLTQSLGTSAPATTYPGQVWADTTNHVLKRRNEANSAWSIIDTLDTDRVLSKSAAYTVLVRDVFKLIEGDTTGGGFTFTLPAVANVGEGAQLECKNTGTGSNALTLDGNGAETINGSATLALSDGQSAIVWCDGAAWRALVIPANAASGKVLQVVSTETGAVATGTTQIPFDDTIPQNTEGDEYMTLSITPTSATSKLIIEVTWNGACSIAAQFTVALFQDSTANALAAANSVTSTDDMFQIKFSHVMTAGTTSATTFKVRAGPNGANTTTFNGRSGARVLGGVMASSIVITEVSP